MKNSLHLSGMVACVLLSGLTVPASAQLPQTRLYVISPTGAQTGQTIELTILAGDDLEEVDKLTFSHSGITATQKMTEKDGQQVPVANVFVVNVAGDVPPGIYECRCGGLFGFSNPRRFIVGTLPEKAEETDNGEPSKAKPIDFDTVVNGRMESGNDVDWFRFSAKSGQRIVFDVAAQRIDSKLAAVLTIFDASGRRRLAATGTLKEGNPVLVFDAPGDGEYLLQLRDLTYRSGNELTYRLTPSTRPCLEYCVPPAGQAGTTGKFTLFGYNLPGGRRTETKLRGAALESLDVDIPVPGTLDKLDSSSRVAALGAGIDGFTYQLPSAGGPSNPILIGIAGTPVATEQEPNDEPAQAQKIGVGTEVGGAFARVGDLDHYRFQAEAGQLLAIDVIAERMGRKADPVLIVSLVKSKDDGTEEIRQLTVQDDVPTQLQQNIFETKTYDPVFQLDVPETGTYQVTLRDRYWESRGDGSLQYRLIVRKRTPDFRLVVAPSAPNPGQTWATGLRKGDSFPLTVYAFRQDGFDGPIAISAANLPAGITCPDVVMNEKVGLTTLVCTATNDAQPGLYGIEVRGSAQAVDPEAVRNVAAAQKAVDDAGKPIADLQKALDQTNQALEKAKTEHEAAAKAAADAPDNKGLADQAAAKKQALDQATANQQAAQQKLAAQQQTIADLGQKLAQAKQAEEQARRSLTRQARSATVVWSFQGNQPAIVRVEDRVTLTVLAETAPFQVATELHKVEANQSRQVLVPVKLEKREFDDKVTLTVQDLPNNVNIEFPNGAIEKGQAESLIRLFVKDNAVPGTYTVWLKSQGQVSYRRNPAKAERLKQIHEEKKTLAEAAKAKLTEATAKKNESVNLLNQANQMVQQAQADLTQKQKAFETARQQKEQGAKESQQSAEKLAAEEKLLASATQAKSDAENKLKSTEEALVAAETALQTAEKALNDAKTAAANAEQARNQAKQASDAQPDNEDLKKALADAEAALKAAQAAQQTADQGRTDAAKARDTMKAARDQSKTAFDKAVADLATAQKNKEAAAQAKTAADTKAATLAKAADDAAAAMQASQQDLTKKQEAAKAADEAKKAAEAAEKAAQDAATATENARKAAETEFTNANNAAAPKNINFTPPSTPIVLVVKPAPVKLTASVPDGGNLKQGGQLAVKVTVARQNGFTGPVTLSLPIPPGVQGVSADAPEIPADQTEGTITLSAAGDAPEAQLANLVIRANMTFDGAAAVDAPITVKVIK